MGTRGHRFGVMRTWGHRDGDTKRWGWGYEDMGTQEWGSGDVGTRGHATPTAPTFQLAHGRLDLGLNQREVLAAGAAARVMGGGQRVRAPPHNPPHPPQPTPRVLILPQPPARSPPSHPRRAPHGCGDPLGDPLGDPPPPPGSVGAGGGHSQADRLLDELHPVVAVVAGGSVHLVHLGRRGADQEHALLLVGDVAHDQVLQRDDGRLVLGGGG